MKNTHIRPTDKPSKGYGLGKCIKKLYDVRVGEFIKTYHLMFDEEYFQPQNIYITNDEEIKEGDYVCASGGFRFVKTLNNDKAKTFIDDGIISKQNPLSSCHLSNYKKIILTTDPDLIKEGIQAIDDEFLEWFVKNPSCEEVKVNDWMSTNGTIAFGGDKRYQICNHLHEKIIIPKEEKVFDGFLDSEYGSPKWKFNYKTIAPKEEPKQETLEEDFESYELAEKLFEEIYGYKAEIIKGNLQHEVKVAALQKGMVYGSKWQAKRDYSEEEVLQLLLRLQQTESYDNLYDWFEQFKKK